MNQQIVISGFGGQGIVFAGKLLAEAAMRANFFCTYFPSYGVAMRGGAAKCDVVISDYEIGSPVIDSADIVVAMSMEALHRYESLVRPHGTLVINTSLISESSFRSDITVAPIDATERATVMGNKMVATLLCLGYVGALVSLPCDVFWDSLERQRLKFGTELLALNKKAIEQGWNLLNKNFT